MLNYKDDKRLVYDKTKENGRRGFVLAQVKDCSERLEERGVCVVWA